MPLPVSKKKVGLGRALQNKKARLAQEARESGRHTTEVNPDRLRSVTQERDLDEFLSTAQLAATDFTAEKQNVRIIHTPTVGSAGPNPFLLSTQEEKDALRKHWEHRTQLRVPRRPPWTKSMTPQQLDRQEKDAILNWRRNLAILQEKENLLLTPYERNLEVWRQLWRVMERSHLLVQIVDARNPLRFRCADLESYVKDVEGPEGEKGTGKGFRKSLMLINKSDLLTQEQRRQWADHFDKEGIEYAFFSALDAKLLQEARAAELAKSPSAPSSPTISKSTPQPAEALAKDISRLGVEDQEGDGTEESDVEDEQSDEDESSVADDDSEGDEPRYFPKARDENEDARTRVLSVLELEALFLARAPDLSKFADGKGSVPFKLTVGLVGYPNVGKSSTINALLGEKKVSVSSTPGKTKHFQTIHLSPTIMLCDCPGLVFPQFATTKAELICDGVLPIDQMREYSAPVALVVKRIPADILEATYGLTIRRKTVDEGGDGNTITEWELLSSYAIARGFARSGVGNPDEARASRYILKDYVNGKLLYCHSPPDVDDVEFNRASHQDRLKRLLEHKRKQQPTTRVGKMADTFSSPSTLGSGGQSARSRALDEGFFEGTGGIASRPIVQGTTRAGSQISRNQLYPHQNLLADDGTLLGGKRARVAAILQQVGNDAAGGKKHYKPRRTKLRKQFATVGYDD